MKIVFLSFYTGAVERGVENWVSEMVKGLAKNHQVKVFQVGEKVEDPHFERINIHLNWKFADQSDSIKRRFYLDYWSRKIFQFTQKVIEKLDQEEFDLIIPTNGGWQSVLIRLYCWKRRKKMIVVGHSGIGWDDYVNLFIRPDIFVALTDKAFNWAGKVGLGTKVVRIINGVDTVFFQPRGEKVCLDLPGPIFLVVSALVSWKRVDFAIKAVAKLGKGSLVVLGEGDLSQRKEISDLGNKLLKGRFLFKTVPFAEMSKWYRSCDLVTFPSSEREAFGLVILEAMACNKPVVADYSRREIIGKAGLLCDPSDLSNYTKTLGKALEVDFGDKPRKQAEKFSWKKVILQYEQLFLSL